MSTRNNNFSNRNQKGSIYVFASKSKSTISTIQSSTDSSSSSSSSKLSAGYTALIVIILIGLIGTIIYLKRNYDSLRKQTINLQRSFQADV